MKKQYKIGIFSFTGCEGCMMNFLEIMNNKWYFWSKYIEISYCRQIKKQNNDTNLDISIIEGALSTEHEVNRIKDIRKNSQTIIVIGSCAINGNPSNHRNNFDTETQKQIKPFLQKWHHLEKVIPIKSVIDIEFEINGCPMDEKKFIEVFENIILK